MPPGERIDWIDAARAICVLGVVLLHTTLSAYLPYLADGGSTAAWRWIIDAMAPFRLPALAMVSGLLLSHRIRAGWVDRSVRVSVATSGWLYAIWLLIFALFAGLIGSWAWTAQIGTGDGIAWNAFFSQLVLPRTLLWYVFALAVWTALLTTVHRADPATVLVVLAALSAASAFLPPSDDNDQYRNVIRCAVFFAIGVYGSSWLRRRIPTPRRGLVLGSLALFLGSTVVTLIADNPSVAGVLAVPRDAAAGVLLLVISALLCRVGWLRAPLAWVGRRTLPIYVLHGIVLDALSFIPRTNLLIDRAVVRPIAPLLITAIAAAACLGVHELLRRLPTRVLFELPAPVRRRLLSSGSRHRS